MKKIKEFLKAKATKVAVAASGAMMALAGVASAAEGDTTTTGVDLTSSLQTGFQGIVTQAGQVLAVIVPIALGLAGTIWLAKRAIGWFRGMAKG